MAANTNRNKPGLSLARLSEVAQIAVQSRTQPADAEIDISLIYSEKQVRLKFRNLQELAESLKINGIIEPLVVHAEADGRYRIIVGERRFRAAPLAGLGKVPVIIKRGLNDLQIRRIQVTENNDRDDLTAFEEAEGVIQDVENYGTKEAMSIWNRGESWISKRIAVKRYASPVKELLQSEKCGDFEVLHCLNRIYAAEKNHAEYFRIHNRINQGSVVSRDEVRNILARIKKWQGLQKTKEQEKKQNENQPQGGQGDQQELQGGQGDQQEPQGGQGDQQELQGGQGDQQELQGGQGGQQELQGQGDQQELQGGQRRDKRPKTDMVAYYKKGMIECQTKVFDYGISNKSVIQDVQAHLRALEADMQTNEWTLWQCFLTMTLPILEVVGSDRAIPYLKKLQLDLKSRTPEEVWTELHTDGEGKNTECPKMPEDWFF